MYKIDKLEKEKIRVINFWKLLSITLYIVLIPIIICVIVLITESILNPEIIPDILGYKNFVIISGSMEPTIHKEDVIFVKKVTQDEIKENDIIAFKDGDSVTTHRIVSIIDKNGIKVYKTKGDNNNVEDKGYVTYDEIEGKYQFKIRGIWTFIKILKSKLVIAILIVILIISLMYKRRIKNRKKLRSDKREKYELDKEKNI